MDLPFPIAHLVRRAHNAKGPKERHDTAFFARPGGIWLRAVATILDTLAALTGGTYTPHGRVAPPGYVFQRSTTSASETLANSGMGAPVKGGILASQP